MYWEVDYLDSSFSASYSYLVYYLDIELLISYFKQQIWEGNKRQSEKRPIRNLTLLKEPRMLLSSKVYSVTTALLNIWGKICILIHNVSTDFKELFSISLIDSLICWDGWYLTIILNKWRWQDLTHLMHAHFTSYKTLSSWFCFISFHYLSTCTPLLTNSNTYLLSYL